MPKTKRRYPVMNVRYTKIGLRLSRQPDRQLRPKLSILSFALATRVRPGPETRRVPRRA
jgi:hypothetical protein